jgi:hypothetical protein
MKQEKAWRVWIWDCLPRCSSCSTTGFGRCNSACPKIFKIETVLTKEDQTLASSEHFVKSISSLHPLQTCVLSNSSEKISVSLPHFGHLHEKDFRFLNCSNPGQCCGVDISCSSCSNKLIFYFDIITILDNKFNPGLKMFNAR